LLPKQDQYYDEDQPTDSLQPKEISPGPYPYEYAKQAVQAYITDRRYLQNFDPNKDIFSLKSDQAAERIQLIKGDMRITNHVTEQNLKSLYQELLMLGTWEMQLPFEKVYSKERTWLDLKKMVLDVRKQIREEIRSSARDTAMLRKELRDAILEHRLETKQMRLMDTSTLEKLADETIEENLDETIEDMSKESLEEEAWINQE
jgi:hypothetical protein